MGGLRHRQLSKPLHLVFGLLLVGALGSKVHAATKPSENDTVRIISDPPGARVEIDGRYLGTTPLEWRVGNWALNPRKLTALSKHLGVPLTMTVMKEGFAPKTIRLTGEPIPWSSLNGRNRFEFYIIQSTIYRVKLDRGMSNEDVIQLRNGGLSDEVIVSKIMSSPASYLVDTAHLFELKRAGISDRVVAAMLEAQNPERMRVANRGMLGDSAESDPPVAGTVPQAPPLDPPPPPVPPEDSSIMSTASVRFTSVHAGAEVYIDGEYFGSTPTAKIQLTLGPHTVVIRKRGYKRWEHKITISAGDAMALNAELEPEPQDPNRPKITGLDQSR